ncbi:hypothetical protein [Brevibacterium sp. Marseille-P9724]|uniref:hypothetical protein n=1 Tax=Brevibacterium sp. Marseille-P9724 TaxID=2614125 RepID=UPI00125FBFFD|nr:hypothetical protein [Brevibacterium sp. Marseille-P9724]
MRKADAGRAPIEFIFASIVLIIPLVYGAVAFAQVQSAAYAAQASAVDAARAAARYPQTAQERAQQSAKLHFADFGLDSAEYTISFDCAGDCQKDGTRVTATVRSTVPLPGIPNWLASGGRAGITVQSEHADIVAAFGEVRP